MFNVYKTEGWGLNLVLAALEQLQFKKKKKKSGEVVVTIFFFKKKIVIIWPFKEKSRCVPTKWENDEVGGAATRGRRKMQT